jgi:hypothetical protein
MPVSAPIATALVGAGFLLGLLYGRTGHEPRPLVVRAASSPALLPTANSGTPLDNGERDSGNYGGGNGSSSTAAAAEAPAPFLLVGVISSPASFGRRGMLRSFAEATAGPLERRVSTEFIFGDRFYEDAPSSRTQNRLAAESREHGDVVFVDARERLPHVGKATEKSAAWWLTAPKRSRARFFCKTDDDSLLHHEHLTAALTAAEQQAQGRQTFFSYIRWRGWLPHFRFQACGGGWGGPIDAIRHLEDPAEQCRLAEGPFPQGTGQLTCLSRELALILAPNARRPASAPSTRLGCTCGTTRMRAYRTTFGAQYSHRSSRLMLYTCLRRAGSGLGSLRRSVSASALRVRS